MIRLIHKLDETGAELGHPLKNHIVTLDKRDYKAKHADDSDGGAEEDDQAHEEQKGDQIMV